MLTTLLSKLPVRKQDAHKGDFGHVLIVGGAVGMLGSVILAAQGASYVGAGKITVATHSTHAALVSVAQPNVMSYGVDSVETLSHLLERATVVVLGPGLGQDNWAHQLFATVLNSSLPLIIDADGLNLLAVNPHKKANWILTPHPGEAARLLNVSTQAIQADRLVAVQALRKKYGGISVLKGAGTLVFDGEREPLVCNAGNPGMATGGMGDLLSGMIAGLVAQHLTLFDAAVLGVYLHAQAGDLAAKAYGERGLQPQTLLPFVQKLINS